MRPVSGDNPELASIVFHTILTPPYKAIFPPQKRNFAPGQMEQQFIFVFTYTDMYLYTEPCSGRSLSNDT